jgi:hypothetical protein
VIDTARYSSEPVPLAEALATQRQKVNKQPSRSNVVRQEADDCKRAKKEARTTVRAYVRGRGERIRTSDLSVPNAAR